MTVKIFPKEFLKSIPSIKPSKYDVGTILVESGLCKSKSEARRVIAQGGVRIWRDVKETKLDK